MTKLHELREQHESLTREVEGIKTERAELIAEINRLQALSGTKASEHTVQLEKLKQLEEEIK